MLINVCFALYLSFEKKKIDFIVDMKKTYSEYMKMYFEPLISQTKLWFPLNISDNFSHQSNVNIKETYESDIVFGSFSTFQADYLR